MVPGILKLLLAGKKIMISCSHSIILRHNTGSIMESPTLSNCSQLLTIFKNHYEK